MLHSIEIENFQGIKHLNIEKLNQITIIGGKNNTGKTSVLRAIKDLFYFKNKDKYEDLNKHYDLNDENIIKLIGKYFFKKEYIKNLIMDCSLGCSSSDENFDQIVYGFRINFISTNQMEEYKKAIEKFIEIFKLKRETQIIECMKIIDSNISTIHLIENEIYIDYNNKNERLPANLSGEGLLRLFTLAVAIATSPNGIVLIDEFENGLHWSTLTKVWEFIAAASKEFNCQIICTTHSYELLRYANDVMQKNNIDLGYIRLSKKDEELKAYHFDQESIDDALSSDLEVR